VKALKAHIWDRQEDEHYVEPEWCSRRLFDKEKFVGQIWEPCCGFGTISKVASETHKVFSSDIVDRGYKLMDVEMDFLAPGSFVSTAPNIVCNPPFDNVKAFALHAMGLRHTRKAAMIFPTARLNAARWLQFTPLRRIWLMTPRPSMPPGEVIARGEKPGGGKVDFCWLVWERGYSRRPPEMRWLHRDGK